MAVAAESCRVASSLGKPHQPFLCSSAKRVFSDWLVCQSVALQEPLRLQKAEFRRLDRRKHKHLIVPSAVSDGSNFQPEQDDSDTESSSYQEETPSPDDARSQGRSEVDADEARRESSKSASTSPGPPEVTQGFKRAEMSLSEQDRALGLSSSPSSKLSSTRSAWSRRLELELGVYTGRKTALERFKAELARPDDDIDLLRAAAYIAQHAYPSLDPEAVIQEVDEMAVELEQRLPAVEERYPLRMVKAINSYLFDDLKYKGEDLDYYSVNNSCINVVLKQKTGIPITLCLVYMELAKRVGFPMVGVNLPAHFMIRPLGEGLGFFIDAFENGKVVFLQDAEEKLAKIYNSKVVISPEFIYQQTVSNRDILIRMLNNLKQIYFQKNNPASALAVIEYLKTAKPGNVEELRDAGLCLYLLRRYPEATTSLEEYLKLNPGATDAYAIRLVLEKMRGSTA